MINLNLREVLKQTSNLSARKNGSHVDLSYNLEAEIEVICIPEFDQFPFNRHTCHVNVSHKCKINPTLFQGDQLDKNRGPIDLCCQQDVDADEATRDDPLWLRPHCQLSHWKRVSWTQFPMNIVLVTKAGPGVKFLTVWFQPWRFKSKWHLLCCRFGAQLPHEVDAVTIFPMTYLDFSQVHFLVLHTNRPYRGDLLDLFPSPLHLLSRKVFHQIFKRSLEIFWQDGTSGHRLSASHQHLLWGCQRHSEHQWRA